jgi:hypothetical protein
MQALRRKDLKELADKFQIIIDPLKAAVEHIKESNRLQQEANLEAARINRELHRSNNRQNWTIGLIVLTVGLAFVQTVRMHLTDIEQKKQQSKLESLSGQLEEGIRVARDNGGEAKRLFTELRMLKDRVEDAPRMTIDEQTGEPLWDMAITEEKARALKKPRRRPSAIAKRIKVVRPEAKPSSKKAPKPRAQVPMGY